MLRHRSRWSWVSSRFGTFGVLGAALFAALPADAAPAPGSPQAPATSSAPTTLTTSDGLPGRRLAIETPLDQYATPNAPVSPTIYLERCRGGCLIHRGAANDARTNTSTIPNQDSTVGEFANSTGQIGSAADAEWGQVVQCMKEVYSPYNVTITDVKPSAGASYHEALIAGLPTDIGQTSDILGLAPLAGDCSAIDNVISFTFANRHPPAARVYNICWTAAQESAHAFGLDHEYEFVAGNVSACSDPMTYRTDCGGEKFFRNAAAICGETATRPCKCGPTQNSHGKLLSVFGPQTPITGPPTVVLTSPVSGGTFGRSVIVQAGSKRGVAHVDLLFNGYKWALAPGAAFTADGQPDPFDYTIPVPAALPDGVIDIEAIAYDDLDASAETPVVTLTKGAPCASAATCAEGQKCEAGKCFWDPPTGELGDSCTYPQFCQSGICTGTKDQQICTQNCIPGVADGCPAGLSCVRSSATDGVCFFSTGGGCCSVDRGGQGWFVHGGIAAILLGYLRRRRRRRR